MSVLENEPKPQLALLQGGKGTINWLGKLPEGTVFLTRELNHIKGEPVNYKFTLIMFQVVEKSKDNVRLMVPTYVPNVAPQFTWVDPFIFSSYMEQVEILALGEGSSDTGDNTE